MHRARVWLYGAILKKLFIIVPTETMLPFLNDNRESNSYIDFTGKYLSRRLFRWTMCQDPIKQGLSVKL